MCYTGRCKYEDHEGECQVRRYNVLKGLPVNHYPDDAGCVVAEKEIEEMEKMKNEKEL